MIDFKREIAWRELEVRQAEMEGRSDKAQQYRQEIANLRKDEWDAQQAQAKFPMFTVSTDPAYVTKWETEDSNSFNARRELDQKRNLKLFIHFAQLFSERYPGWTLTPDPKNPFKGVELSKGKYRIESAYPDNAVKLIGVERNQGREDAAFHRRRGILNGVFNTEPETVPTYTFFGWALGMDDTPEWIKE